MNQPNPYEFKFSAEAIGAVRAPVLNYLFKVLGPSFVACLLFVWMGTFLVRMFPVLGPTASLYFFAVVVFVPFFQTSRCIRLPSQAIPSANRAFVFGIGAIVAFVGAVFVRGMLFQAPYLVSNAFMAVTTSALLILFRRIVFGEMKTLPLIVSILPTSVFTVMILAHGALLWHQRFPVQSNWFGLEAERVVLCLYAHVVCASWWLSDKMALRVQMIRLSFLTPTMVQERATCDIFSARSEMSPAIGASPPGLRFCTGKLTHAAHQLSQS